jgi:hypothetical protein
MTLRCLLLLSLLAGGARLPARAAGPPAGEPPAAGAGGLMFIENAGQFPPAVRFYARQAETAFWITDAQPAADEGRGEGGDASASPVALWIAYTPRDDGDQAGGTDGRFEFAPPSPIGDARGGPAPAGAEADQPRGVALRLSFPDANLAPRLVPTGRLSTHVSYFRGDDPARWRGDAPAWAGVRLEGLYDGIDLEISGRDGRWAWRLAPSAAPGESWGGSGFALSGGEVRLRIEGADAVEWLPSTDLCRSQGQAQRGSVTPDRRSQTGSEHVDCDLVNSGTGPALRARTALGDVILPWPAALAPASITPRGGQTFELAARFDPERSAEPGAVAAGQPQTDSAPQALAYATYLGGSLGTRGYGLAVDAAGDAYVTGMTSSPDFPTTPGVFGRFYHGGPSDVFVAKVNSAGSALVYATFIGGAGDDLAEDVGNNIAIDAAGNAYVIGRTNSRRFPTTPGAYDTTFNGSDDVFVLKLNATGTALLYSTFLGGRKHEAGLDIVVDSEGAAYLTGWTLSGDFPTLTAPAYAALHGGYDTFVTKLNSVGSALAYSMLVGGQNTDVGNAIAVRGSRAYVAGYTSSPDFPQVASLDATLGGVYDAFVVMADDAGANLLWATYLGGSKSDAVYDLAVNATGEAFVTGTTDSEDFPVTGGAADTSWNGGYHDAFVARLRWLTSYSVRRYATFLGYSGSETGYAIALDRADNAYVTGLIGDDAATRLVANGSSAAALLDLARFTGRAIATDPEGGVYLLGDGSSLPVTPNAFDTTGADSDAWLAKIVVPNYVRGRVTDAHGQPLAGIVVSAGGAWQGTTDATGSYTLTVPAGAYTFGPASAYYFWQPAQRSVAIPPDAAGQDFRGSHIRKQATAGVGPVAYGQVVTYTVEVISPPYGAALLYDAIPLHTTYVEASLKKPWSSTVAYDAAANAITGTLSGGAVTFAVRVAVTGTVSAAPIIANRACLRPPGSAETACEWSEEVRHFTYVWPLYLPVIRR